jgi:capsular polysaccharide biosynthesis protein
MTVDQKTRESDDVGSYVGALTHNWWLILALVFVGILAGVVLTLLQPTTYDATSSVYIGQTTDANGNPMAGLNSNAKAATQLLASQALLDEAAEKAGGDITAASLRRETTVETPSSTIKTAQSIVNIVVITVRNESAERAAAAANALAQALLDRLGKPVEARIALLERQVSDLEDQLARAQESGYSVGAALDVIAHSDMTKAEKAVASAPYIAVAQAAATQAEALTASLQKAELMLLTAKNVEQPRILHEAAVPDTPSGPDMRLNVAAGALAGLVVGMLTAFVRQRRVGRPA